MNPLSLTCVLLYFILGTLSQAQAQSKLYWADATTIWRGNLDGTNVVLIQTDIDSLTALSVDPENRKLYWSTQTQVWRAGLTGTNPELLFEGDQIWDIFLDNNKNKLYLTSPLIRLTPDGTKIDAISTQNFKRFTLDTQNQNLYGILGNRIQSTALDTSGNIGSLRPIFNSGSFDDLLFLPNSQRIYGIDTQNDIIWRGNPQTNKAETVLQNGLINVRGIAVDENAQKIYWTTKSRPSSTVSTIYRANTDGSNIKEVTSVSSNGGWVKDLLIYYPASGNASFGDVNGDGRIDSVDVIILLKGIVGLDVLTAEQKSRADVNADKSIDSRDATLILRRIVNLINNFPAESQ